MSENVIQPGVGKVTDPNFQASVKGYMSEAQKKAAAVGTSANDWSRSQFGVDVADTVGGAVGVVKDRVMGGPSRSGYGQISLASPNDYRESSGLYSPDDTDNFFSEYERGGAAPTNVGYSSGALNSTAQPTKQVKAKKEDDWDDWKDF